jgi:hypothetical protein
MHNTYAVIIAKVVKKTAGEETESSLNFHKFPTPLFQKVKKWNNAVEFSSTESAN